MNNAIVFIACLFLSVSCTAIGSDTRYAQVLPGTYDVTLHSVEIDSIKISKKGVDRLAYALGQMMRIRARLTEDSIFWSGNMAHLDANMSIHGVDAHGYQMIGDSLQFTYPDSTVNLGFQKKEEGFELYLNQTAEKQWVEVIRFVKARE